ncbi:MAG TPA: DUF4347 domain-containing protein, partial [Reyranella sp.]|nr:DUF4347 domain-containing protein [Reyranella sp.]
MYDGAGAATAAAATQPHADASASGSATSAASGSAASSPSASGSSAAAASPAPSSAAPAADPAADHPATPPAAAAAPAAAPAPSTAPADSGNASGPADSSPAGGTSAAPAETPSNVGHQIVFIDGNVPDVQTLVQGVQAGIEVVVLDPNTNGVQQIADYLTSHNEQNLDAIQIVSHGEDATVRLGNTILGLADISMFSTQLATIGQALKPGGDILFYGCNVGEGFSGALFEVQMSIATGGAHVAASSGLVGAAALGGSWTLDVADGVINVGNPFTAATLGQYGDILTNQIWFTGDNSGSGSAGSELVTANVSGATATSPNSTPPGFTTPPNPPFTDSNPWANTAIALDAADGLYFITNNPVAAGNAQIYEGHISGSGGLTQIYSTPNTNGVDFLGEMVYNAPNHKLYFVVADNTAPDGLSPAQAGGTVDTGIFTLNIAADGTASSLHQLVSWGGASGIQNPYGIAIDNTNNLLFITDFGDSHNVPQAFNPRLEVANLTNGAILNSSLQFLDASQNNPNYFYYIWGVEVDPASHKLYWTTADPNNNATSIAHNQIFSATYSTGATPTLSNITALYTATTDGPNPTNLSIDVANGVYYVGLGSSAITTGTIVEGSLSTANGTQTTIYTLPTDTQPHAILYEAAPVLSVTGASPTALPGGSAVDLTSSVTVTDTLQNIASATVTISSGLLSGDTLSFHNGASSWTFADGNTINATYTSGTGVLTLSGAASAADYQQALDSVSFATSATTGASRSFSWSTTDGHLASAVASSSASVHLAPIISTSGTVTFNGGGSPTVLDSTLTVSSPTTPTLASATISIDSGHFLTGDSLNFVNTSSVTEGNIAVQSYDAVHGVLTLVSSGATATLAQWQAALRSITYSFTANGDPTGGGGDTTRTITWTVNDGTASSAADTSVLTAVHTAPTVDASGTVTFTGGGSPVTLDSTLALTVPDSNGNLAGATVTIGGFQTVDRLSINGQTS